MADIESRGWPELMSAAVYCYTIEGLAAIKIEIKQVIAINFLHGKRTYVIVFASRAEALFVIRDSIWRSRPNFRG